MTFSDDWLPAIRSKLCDIRPAGPMGADAQPLPALSPVNTIDIVGIIVPNVIFALENWAFIQGGTSFGGKFVAERSSFLEADGTATQGLTAAIPVASDFIDGKTYLAGYPNPSMAWIRSQTAGGWAFGASQTFEVWESTSIVDHAQIVITRDMMAAYQRLLDASAAAILAAGADLSLPWQTDEAQGFWAALESLCASLDLMQVNPPVLSDITLGGVLSDSLHSASEWLGKAAADVSHEVGAAAGNLVSGFFQEAGLLAVAVAGIAIYLFVK
jgi:hypothetical protein